MIVGLHDAEKDYFRHGKTFPQPAPHKDIGLACAIIVNGKYWSLVVPVLHHDMVLAKKVFDFTPDNPDLPENITVEVQVSWLPMDQELSPEVDAMYPGLLIYPDCDYAIGYLTRICFPITAAGVVVPRKEGQIRAI